MSSKWTSRKFWVTIITGLSGMATAIWGASTGATVETVAGLTLTILVSLGYIHAESKVDSARINAGCKNK
jgi:hypothetical protein